VRGYDVNLHRQANASPMRQASVPRSIGCSEAACSWETSSSGSPCCGRSAPHAGCTVRCRSNLRCLPMVAWHGTATSGHP
jgi:hypothetical protein